MPTLPLRGPVLWVTGDTTWTDLNAIDKAMGKWLKPGGIVITGGANGADSMAMSLAAHHGCFTMTVPYYGPGGRAGGPMRNQVIAEVCSALWDAGYNVVVAAFGHGNGTNDSALRASGLGLKVVWHR